MRRYYQARRVSRADQQYKPVVGGEEGEGDRRAGEHRAGTYINVPVKMWLHMARVSVFLRFGEYHETKQPST